MSVDRVIWVLNQTKGIGAQTFKLLCEKIDDLNLLSDPNIIHEVRASVGLPQNVASEFISIFKSSAYEQECETCFRRGIRMVSIQSREYPKNLAQIFDPPLILYVKGTLVPEDELAVAIVGSRNASLYGLKVCG